MMSGPHDTEFANFKREDFNGYVTEWRCDPPSWGARFIVTEQHWTQTAGGRPLRIIGAWVHSGNCVDCGDYRLQVVKEL